MLTIGEAATFLGVSRTSLRRWDKLRILKAYRTPGGHRRYQLSDLNQFYSPKKLISVKNIKSKHILCYARVSSHKQKEKGDLQRQIAKLETEAHQRGDEQPILIKDVGSGLNPNRSGLKKAFKLVKAGEVSTILLTFKDRLTRFGFLYIYEFCHLFNVEIIEIDQIREKTVQESLVDDMMTLIACFSGKLYGLRSGKTRKKHTRLRYFQKFFRRLIQEESNQIVRYFLPDNAKTKFTKSVQCKL